MSTSIYRLDVGRKVLATIQKKSMEDLGLKEAYDLEAWLASSSAGLFGRDILWISRQDRPVHEQRSDLIGVAKEGDLLITELKRGTLDESAITQVLAYAAEYARKTANELAALFADQSSKTTTCGLVAKATSPEDARQKLSVHVGTNTELNETQILLLMGEEFTPNALAICDYLNESSGDATTFSLECWKYTVFEESQGNNLLAIEQILPPPNSRQAIDERREASKARKYARDPARKEFMYALMTFLHKEEPGLATRSRGASYDCSLKKDDWKDSVQLSVHDDRPRLIFPDGIGFSGNASDLNLEEGKTADGRRSIAFNGVLCGSAKFDVAFGERLLKAVEGCTVEANGSCSTPSQAPSTTPTSIQR